MGNSTGSYTAKVHIIPLLYPFTKWNSNDIRQFLIRGMKELPETFGIRKFEFEYLVGDQIEVHGARSLFSEIFDSDKNGLVDKFEVMCVIGMTSKISSLEKVHYFFDLFNFNDKGYLNESEMTLLFMAVTRGAYKIDKKFQPPSAKLIKTLVDEALTYAKTEAHGIRKPELVQFVVNNPSVTAYLECWRGHASQVLVADECRWRDMGFPCNDEAVCPGPKWMLYGLPPDTFIHWRRRDRVGTELGCEQLFAHTVSFLKTIDRRKVYKGLGILGTGHLKQGFLADRWFLSSLAAMTTNPETLLYNFITTGQEDRGRFCVRFYEGGRWRTIYVDDRIPCGPNYQPLFASSSCSFEAWPLIIEKALAKYFGSYGHIGVCSGRADSTMAALRLLTGGHVLRYYVKDYDWKSYSDDVRGENGFQFIMDCIKEGSVVSLGRSSATMMMNTNSTSKVNPASYVLPPLGRLFPVAASANLKGYNYLVLKDPWGIIADCDKEVNFESGHSNTFKIKVEEIPLYYDTIIMSRFPDSLRAAVANKEVSLLAKISTQSAAKMGPVPWKTEVLSAITKGKEKPAVFLLKLTKPVATKEENKSYVRTSDGVGLKNEEETNYRLKDRADFSRDATRRPLNGNKLSSEKKKKEKSQQTESQKKSVLSAVKVTKNGDLIDLCLTISSSCDWSFGGSSEAAPKLRMRLIPTEETIEAIKAREAQLMAADLKEKEQAEARKQAQDRLLQIQDDQQPGITNEEKIAPPQDNSEGNSPKVVVGKSIQQEDDKFKVHESNSGEYCSANKADRDYARYLDIIFTAERNWCAQCLQLLPGEYYLIADVSYKVSYLEAKKRCIPRDISDAPWIEAKLIRLILEERNQVGRTFIPPQQDDSVSVYTETSVQKLEKKLFPENYKKKKDLESVQSLTKMRQRQDGEDPDTVEHRIWLEASTVDDISVSTIKFHEDIKLVGSSIDGGLSAVLSALNHDNGSVTDGGGSVSATEHESDVRSHGDGLDSVTILTGTKPEKNDKDNLPTAGRFYNSSSSHHVHFPQPLLPEVVQHEKWPFLAETQPEVSSRELVNTMSSLREEAELLGAEFIALAAKYREERKRLLLSSKQSTS